MISIRYHIFSLVAVFLALAIGLAAGSTVVKESIVDNLRDNQDRLESELDELQSANDELNLRVGRLEETDRRLREEGPAALLGGRLLGISLVVVTGEGLDGDTRERVLATLGDAGAEIVGQIEVRRDVGREERQAELAEVVGAAPDDDPVAVAAGDLAAALLAVDAPDPLDTAAPLDDAESDPSGAATSEPPTTDEVDADPPQERVALDDLLGSLEDAGFVAAEGAVADATTPILRAPMFVIVGGRPDDEDVSATAFLDSLTGALVVADEQPPRVAVGDAALADPSAPRAPLVDAVRDDGDVWDGVTSVDDLEMFAGLAALTIGVDDLRAGTTGHYGVGDGADSLLPVGP